MSSGVAVSTGQHASLSHLAVRVRWAHPGIVVASTKVQPSCTQYRTQFSLSLVEGSFSMVKESSCDVVVGFIVLFRRCCRGWQFRVSI
ncbi:hypothetical protein Bca4012_025272 [Brassica carinata]